jgi:hypothetical protein
MPVAQYTYTQNNTQNDTKQTIHRRTQKLGRVRTVPRLLSRIFSAPHSRTSAVYVLSLMIPHNKLQLLLKINTSYFFIQDTNSRQTQQFCYIITFNATCFNCIELSSGLLENRSNVSIFIVHSGIPKAYSRWYSQYKSGRVRHLIIYTVEYLKLKS